MHSVQPRLTRNPSVPLSAIRRHAKPQGSLPSFIRFSTRAKLSGASHTTTATNEAAQQCPTASASRSAWKTAADCYRSAATRARTSFPAARRRPPAPKRTTTHTYERSLQPSPLLSSNKARIRPVTCALDKSCSAALKARMTVRRTLTKSRAARTQTGGSTITTTGTACRVISAARATIAATTRRPRSAMAAPSRTHH